MENLEDKVAALADALRQTLVVHQRPAVDDKAGSIESLKFELNTPGGGRLSLEYRKNDEERKWKPSEMSSTEAALSNDIILEKILGQASSSVDFLKNFRQVNKKWKQISDLILNRKRMFITRHQLREWHLRRCYVPLCSDFPNTAAGDHPVDQLVQLVHKRNNCFVGNGLYVSASLWTISSPNVRKFLRAYGKRIKYLGIDYNRFQSIRSFSQFLTFFPNLQRLWARRIQISQPLPQLQPSDIPFPHLTSIHFGNADPKLHGFLLDIIKASQSVQQVLNFPCALASAIAEAGKAGIVHEINFKGAMEEEISACAQIPFHLTRFFLPHKGSPALIQVLQANQKTLEKVTLVFPNGLLSPAVSIYLEGLKELTLKEAPELVQNGNTVNIRFPPSFSLRRHYYRLDLHLVGLETYAIPVMDITLGPWFMSLSGIRNMSANLGVYPSVTDLRIGCKNLVDLQYVMDALFRYCGQIRRLHLYNVEYGRFSRHSLDAALTGIPDPTICGDLLRSGVNEQTDIRGLQVLPSILDLADLQELKISFSHRGRDIYKRDGVAKFFTRLSILCGFKRMSNLQKVCLAYDQHDNSGFGADDLAEILEPFKSVSAIVHEASPW